MPDRSKSQARFMNMSKIPEGRAALREYGKTPAPVKVAKEFTAADKKAGGTRKLPERIASEPAKEKPKRRPRGGKYAK